jgi:uncharacterized SAM-binding protein YcdF (DUF218 family)
MHTVRQCFITQYVHHPFHRMHIDIGWIINNIVSALLLPPLNLIVLGGIGILLCRHRPRAGLMLGIGALTLLALLSTNAGALLVVAPLENNSASLISAQGSGAQAIVVLGGGRLSQAPEYGVQDIPGFSTLVRLRYAARLQREAGLPMLVTGGAPDGASESEAALMARTLQEDFAVSVKWLESKSNNTAENAQFSARILQPEGMRRILLVTDALHMSRAKAIFARHGFDVIAAPTIFFSHERLSLTDWIPGGEGLRRSQYALHEWLGLAWYRLRYGSEHHDN